MNQTDILDLLDPVSYRNGYPAAYFRALRSGNCPMWHFSNYEQRGYWIVSTFRHADYIYRNPQLFSSETVSIAPPQEDALETQRKFLVNMDPPRHTAYRKKIGRAFVRHKLDKLQSRIADIALDLIDQNVRRRAFDFVPAVAYMMPLLVMREILGIEAKDLALVGRCAMTLIYYQEPELRSSSTEMRSAASIILGCAARLYETHRENPEHSVIGAWLKADDEQPALSREEFCFAVLQILVAGLDTSQSAIASGVRLLIENPDQLSLLDNNLSLLDAAVDEVLRFEPPGYQIIRNAKEDTELGGQSITKGDKIALIQHSINRDEQLNLNTESFDITRVPPRHRTFGIGPHTCPGAVLAWMELRAILNAIILGAKDIQFVGQYSRLKARSINGMYSMNLSCRPKSPEDAVHSRGII